MDFKQMIVKIQNKCYCKKRVGGREIKWEAKCPLREKQKRISETQDYKALPSFCTFLERNQKGHKNTPTDTNLIENPQLTLSQTPNHC